MIKETYNKLQGIESQNGSIKNVELMFVIKLVKIVAIIYFITVIVKGL